MKLDPGLSRPYFDSACTLLINQDYHSCAITKEAFLLPCIDRIPWLAEHKTKQAIKEIGHGEASSQNLTTQSFNALFKKGLFIDISVSVHHHHHHHSRPPEVGPGDGFLTMSLHRYLYICLAYFTPLQEESLFTKSPLQSNAPIYLAHLSIFCFVSLLSCAVSWSPVACFACPPVVMHPCIMTCPSPLL